MTELDDLALRQELISTAQAMGKLGLSPNRSGNVSVRSGGAMLITPSGLPYDTMQPADIVCVGLDGSVEPGQRKPSAETPFHLAVYTGHETAGAIVHCHSPAASAVACARLEIPAFHYMVAVAGGNRIPLADYAKPGTDQLARKIVTALKGFRGCLLANHGQIAYGASLERALELAVDIESLARMFIDVRALGEMHVLSDAEMDEVLAHFATYGAAPS